MKKTQPVRTKLTVAAQTLRRLTADQLEHATGGGNLPSETCTNNSCLLHVCLQQ